MEITSRAFHEQVRSAMLHNAVHTVGLPSQAFACAGFGRSLGDNRLMAERFSSFATNAPTLTPVSSNAFSSPLFGAPLLTPHGLKAFIQGSCDAGARQTVVFPMPLPCRVLACADEQRCNLQSYWRGLDQRNFARWLIPDTRSMLRAPFRWLRLSPRP